jgi:hypothetical protein
VVPQPQKQPRSSFVRFEASLPNECWQADITHWKLADGTEVDILDFIDNHSRLIVSATARRTTKARDVTATFHKVAATWGYPASVLTDNGAVFNARSRHGVTVLETELKTLGIVYKHSRPYHPQTCGKIERFHQTLKRFLAKQRPARSVAALQAQIDRFVRYYNDERPHRARDRQTPRAAFGARDKARPGSPITTTNYRVRTDKVDSGGNVTLRHNSKLFHIGIGRPFAGTPIKLYVADLDIRVLTEDGKLLRELTLDTSRIYQPRGKGRKK